MVHTIITPTLLIVGLVVGGWFGGANAQIWPFKSETRVDVVTLEWFLSVPSDRDDAAAEAVDALIDIFPECAPRKYGLYEPLRNRVRRGDFEAISIAAAQVWRTADLLFFDTDNEECFAGHFSATVPRAKSLGDQSYASISIDVDRAFIERLDGRGRFAMMAQRLGAFYGNARLSQGYYLDRRGLSLGMDTEWYPASLCKAWCGIPAIPAWLYWLGPQYRHAAIIDDSTAAVELEISGGGIIIAMGPDPMTFDELEKHEIPIKSEYLTNISRELNTKGPSISVETAVEEVEARRRGDQRAEKIPALAL